VCLQRGKHGSEGSTRMHPSGVTVFTLLFVKRGVSEDVYGAALQRLCDMAKARLPESQCPAVKSHHSSATRLRADASESHGLSFRSWNALLAGR
jgi:hypothetical protein